MTAYTLNLLDLAFTLYALKHGAVELNPFMQSVPVMVFYKIVIVGGLLFWLSKRTEPIAKHGRRLVTLVYAGLCIYHAMFLF